MSQALIFSEKYEQRKEAEITPMHLVGFETTIQVIKQYKKVPYFYPDTSILFYRIGLLEEGLLIYFKIHINVLAVTNINTCSVLFLLY
jgi:hypothetical protein